MHHKSGKHDLQSDLQQLMDAVAPRVESAVTAVQEKTPPLVDKGREVAGTVAARGRTVAVEKGTLLAERLPDSLVDRLPDAVTDQLPVRRRGGARKLLLLGLVGALAAAGMAYLRRKGASSGSQSTPSSRPTAGVTTGPTAMTTEAAEQPDPSDPLTEPNVNGRIN